VISFSSVSLLPPISVGIFLFTFYAAVPSVTGFFCCHVVAEPFSRPRRVSFDLVARFPYAAAAAVFDALPPCVLLLPRRPMDRRRVRCVDGQPWTAPSTAFAVRTVNDTALKSLCPLSLSLSLFLSQFAQRAVDDVSVVFVFFWKVGKDRWAPGENEIGPFFPSTAWVFCSN